MSQLRLLLLGPPQVWAGHLPLTFATRKALALLVYLATESDPQPRDKLLALLWPDSAARQGRGVLRTTLAYLRRAFDASAINSAAYVLVQADTVAFNFEADFDLDLNSVLTATRSSELALLEQAARSYRGDFLEGFSLPDAPAFDEWASLQREYWHRHMNGLLDRLSQLQAEARQFETGIATAARWVAHDPINETAHRRLMQLHALSGDRTAALQAYAACQTILKVELGIDTSAETKTLAEQIRRDSMPRRQGHKATKDQAITPSARHSLTPFVGRSAEHAHLTTIYQAVCQGRTQVVIIKGEAGIGKTRLASEFLNWLTFQGADVLRGRAFEAGGRLAYQPLVEAVRTRIEQENAPDDLLSDVWLAEMSRLLPELRERYPDLPPPTADETLAQARLLEALARLGQALAARRPAVLFIDDIQWGDTASLDVLSYLSHTWAERGVAVLLLLSLRAEVLLTNPALGEWLSNLARDAPVTELALGPLSGVETQQLVEALQGSQGSLSPAAFADWLFTETAGQPFYIAETIKILLERGVIQSHADPQGRWLIDFAGGMPSAEAKNPAAAPLIPPGVRQVILARLHQLTLNAGALLTAAAVMGRQCSFERLCQVANLPENESLSALDELLAGRLLLEAGQVARPYIIAHDKIRDVVYAEAGDARRRVYHRRAFEALQAKSAPPAELAYHALAAQLAEPAFHYSLTAGDEAMRLFAVRDAVVHYEEALALVTGDRRVRSLPAHRGPAALGPTTEAALISNPKSRIPNLHHLYLQLGRAYELTNQWNQARAIYQAMLTVAQESSTPEMECTALNRLATLAAQVAYDMETAMEFLQQALRVAESCGDKEVLAETEWNLAQLSAYTWQMEASLAHAQRALVLAQQMNLPELTGRSLTVLGFAENGVARWEEGEAHYEEARLLYHTLGNRALEAESLCGVVRARINLGQSQAAVEPARAAHALNLETGNEWGQAVSAFHLGMTLLECGEYSEALAVTRTGVEVARTIYGFAPLPILNLTVLGQIYRAMLALDAAQAAHQEALAISEDRPYQPLLRMTAAELCADCVLAGDWAAAERYARQSLDATHHSLLHGGLWHWSITEALLHGGDMPEAQAEVARFGQYYGHSRRYRIPYLRCLAVLDLTRQPPLLLEEGEPVISPLPLREGLGVRSAIAHLEEALALAEAMSLPGEQWPILAKLAELYQVLEDEGQVRAARMRAVEIKQALAAKIDDPSLRVEFLAANLDGRLRADDGLSSRSGDVSL
jgi:DNA-binding SARP family transcriptional activator/tetratricopeptide (TPR) repeat protein